VSEVGQNSSVFSCLVDYKVKVEPFLQSCAGGVGSGGWGGRGGEGGLGVGGRGSGIGEGGEGGLGSGNVVPMEHSIAFIVFSSQKLGEIFWVFPSG
jgi:hypothetical protein